MSARNPVLPSKKRQTDAATAVITLVIASVAALFGLAMTLIGVLGIVNAFVGEELIIPVSADAAASVAGAEAGANGLAAATFTGADAHVANASGLVRLLVGSHALLSMVVEVSVAATISILCIALVRGRPFVPLLRRSIVALAFVLVIVGSLARAALAFANLELATEWDLAAFPPAAVFDFTPMIVGVVLALLATAFTVGERLQRDTEGLV
ncbi:hypothetical protein SAMN04489806_1960 [Paramicrobacterium humi]|uniref:DUF2975 domain-containing protein n=1 Tax=Paramicrobacterium humi TaxID=640635 RepID=A0A1H4MRM6_9MICO|nr:hypothetical protein [Microbacterium humi]SEB85696.1 hypothetical protein SAMN04489806_1960 [Microbacterium humi]